MTRFACLLSALLLTGCAATSRPAPTSQSPVRWALVIHAGGQTIDRDAPAERQQQVLDAMAEALRAGQAVLENGGTSLDAVEVTVRVLEESPEFNAGYGAAITATGGHELDAAIMRGDTLAAGAVTGVKTTRNPIRLARHVMVHTPHVFIAGEAADALGADAGLEQVPNEFFRVESRHEQWKRSQEQRDASSKTGTVGAVAVDMHGNLAAATSTGGFNNKMSGRIGDSPIIGAGTYANNATCAISCTGWGEEFIRRTVAHRVSALMEYGGRSLDEAMREVFQGVLPERTGGGVAVDRNGNIVMEFNTRGMNRGAVDSNGRFEVAIWAD